MKNVKEIKGKLYFRRKVNGKDTYHRLPAPDDPRFAAKYARLAKPESEAPLRPTVVSGSLAALIIAYRHSSNYRAIPSADTRTNYARYLDIIVNEHGHRLVRQIRPAHVYLMRDKMAATPGKANNWLTIFRVLMAHSAKLDWRGDNPAAGIKALPLGEHQPWPADLLRVCLEVATPMTRLLIVTGLRTGQRNSDVIRMQYG